MIPHLGICQVETWKGKGKIVRHLEKRKPLQANQIKPTGAEE